MSNDSGALNNTITDIFAQHNAKLEQEDSPRKNKASHGPSTRDLEIATTVLLVDLASSDQNFDQSEYQVITNGLMRLFGTGKTEVTALINQAQLTLKNLRGVSSHAELIKNSLSLDERIAILDVIDSVILADGEIDGFETYLRHKFASLIGVTPEPQQTPVEQHE